MGSRAVFLYLKNQLAFHLEDSESFRAFARMKMGQYLSDSTLQENIKSISPATWEVESGM